MSYVFLFIFNCSKHLYPPPDSPVRVCQQPFTQQCFITTKTLCITATPCQRITKTPRTTNIAYQTTTTTLLPLSPYTMTTLHPPTRHTTLTPPRMMKTSVLARCTMLTPLAWRPHPSWPLPLRGQPLIWWWCSSRTHSLQQCHHPIIVSVVNTEHYVLWDHTWSRTGAVSRSPHHWTDTSFYPCKPQY